MPKILRTNQSQKIQKQTIILNKAIELFAINGIEQTSIDDITKVCNISHGLFYYYFKDKAELLSSAVKLIYKNILSKIDIDSIYNNPANVFIDLVNRVFKSLSSKKGTFELTLYCDSFYSGKIFDKILKDKLKKDESFYYLNELFINLNKINAFKLDDNYKNVLLFFVSTINGFCMSLIQSNFSYSKCIENQGHFISRFIKEEFTHD